MLRTMAVFRNYRRFSPFGLFRLRIPFQCPCDLPHAGSWIRILDSMPPPNAENARTSDFHIKGEVETSSLSANLPPPTETERFVWLERANDDFPYYRGRPVEIEAGRWWIVMAAVAAGFAILILPPPILRGEFTRFVPAILYCAVPLAALALVAGKYWTAIFRPLRGTDFLWMAAFAILNIAVTLVVGAIIRSIMETTANEAVAGAAATGGKSSTTAHQ